MQQAAASCLLAALALLKRLQLMLGVGQFPKACKQLVSQPVILSLSTRFGRGAFADAFALDDGRVAKLFRRKPLDPDGRAVRAIFRAECDGYTRAHSNPAVGRHVAAFFGPQEIAEVLREDGESCATDYWLDCGYVIERLDGEERKILGVPEARLPFVYDLLERLEQLGVRHGADASAFGWQAESTLKVIDIASRDAAADLAHFLADSSGRIVM